MALVSCAELPTQPVSPPKRRAIVDDSPAWSPDGQTIAFHRGFDSSDGPPGVYTISKWGGRPRLIVAGDYAGPRYLRYAPDGRRVVGMWGLQLVIVDLEAGSLSRPMYTHAGIGFPDWSPDGSTIVYNRVFPTYLEPPDSGGLHVFDLATGTDRALHGDDGNVIRGDHARWTRSGREIVFIRIRSDGSELDAIRPDGTARRVIALDAPGTALGDPRPFVQPVTGLEGVLFDVAGGKYPTHFVDLAGRAVTRYPALLGPYDQPSPDGTEFVRVRPQPGDSVGVLFIVAENDYRAAAARQLTFWKPPPEAQPGEVRSSIAGVMPAPGATGRR